jgi:hypothetical protein
MTNALRWYAGWLWQDFVELDALVLEPPVSDPDNPEAFARELYHRYLAHLLAVRVWSLEWMGLGVATGMALLFNLIGGELLPLVYAIFLTLLGIAGAVLGLRYLLPELIPEDQFKRHKATASALVRRVCLRTVPAGTPPDLADPWRHGWLTADGRPVAAEIAEFDLRSTALVDRTRSCLTIAIALGLSLFALTPIGIVVFIVFLLIALSKAATDYHPLGIRGRWLDAAAAGSAEGAAWSVAGGSSWAARLENARTLQMTEAANDTSPMLVLGTALGLMAARGDPLAPSVGLDMGLSLNDLTQHLLVFGGTGAGKTAGVLRPLARQIGTLQSVGLVVLDGKGSLPGEVAKFVPEMTIIDPSGRAMSLVEGLSPTEIVATVADILGGAAGKDRFFEESAAALMRFAAVLAKHDGGGSWSLAGIWTIAREGPSADLIENADLTNAELREAVGFFTKDWPKVEPEVKSSILATLRAWYTTITGHPDTLKWAETAANRSDADLTLPLRGGRIGILAPAHRYGPAGPVVMALLKARIFAAIRDRADRGMGEGETPVVLIVDEAQEVVTKQDALMLGIGRSLRLAIVAATQTVEGIEAKLGAPDAAQYLTLFGSVIALQNRSGRTAQAMAERFGAAFRPVLESVPGVPTVRGAVVAQRASGRLAAIRTQPGIALTLGFGQGGRFRDLLGAINPFQLFGKTLQGQQDRPSSRIGAAPLLHAEELTELTVEPNTALAILTRARVPRRDIIKLKPLY